MVFPQEIYIANQRGLYLGHITPRMTKVSKSCVFGFVNRHDIAKVYKHLYENGMDYISHKLKSGNFCIVPQNSIERKKDISKDLSIDLVDSQQIISLLSINNVNLAFISNVEIEKKEDKDVLILSSSAEIYNLYDTDICKEFLDHMININIDK